MEITNVLISPVVTEKSTIAQTKREYTFLVHPRATKIDIKNAVEKAYKINVERVNIIPILKKVRRAGRNRMITKRHQGKKALVKIAEKQSIDFNKIK